jgi:hypothetical protein
MKYEIRKPLHKYLNKEKLKSRLLLLSLLLNTVLLGVSAKKYLEDSHSGTYDICLAQGNTKIQCEAIGRLIERQNKIEIRN